MEEPDFSPEEEKRCKAALQEGELVLLMAKPRAEMDVVDAWFRRISGCVLLGIMVQMLWQAQWAGWLLLPAALPACLLGGYLLVSPELHRRSRERTVYLLTDRRVLVLESKVPFGERTVAYPLRPDPVREVRRSSDGYGDIVFAYEHRWQLGRRIHRGPSPVGFIDVPEVDRVAQMIARQVELTPAAQPQPAAQPPAWAGLPTETDSWGNAVPTNASRGVMIAVGAVFLVVCTLFLSLGIWFLVQDAAFEREAVRTTATVVSVRQEERKHENSHHRRRHRNSGVSIHVGERGASRVYYVYYPLLQYQDAAGTVHQVESDTGSSELNLPVGHQVEIMYLPGAPAEMRMCGKGPGIGAIFTFIGAFGCIIGGGVLAGGLMMKKP